MNCRFLYIENGWAMCDCRLEKAGGQINGKGLCDPNKCKIPEKQREVRNRNLKELKDEQKARKMAVSRINNKNKKEV